MSVAVLPDLNVLPAEALKALILAQHHQLIATHEQLLFRESEIEHLKLLITKLQRMQFGRKSEKLQRQIEQLELRLEELQGNREKTSLVEGQAAAPPILITTPAAKPARGALPEHLPRVAGTVGGGAAPLCAELRAHMANHFEMFRHTYAGFNQLYEKIYYPRCPTCLKTAFVHTHPNPPENWFFPLSPLAWACGRSIFGSRFPSDRLLTR
jgi:hypothetical protein